MRDFVKRCDTHRIVFCIFFRCYIQCEEDRQNIAEKKKRKLFPFMFCKYRYHVLLEC